MSDATIAQHVIDPARSLPASGTYAVESWYVPYDETRFTMEGDAWVWDLRKAPCEKLDASADTVRMEGDLITVQQRIDQSTNAYRVGDTVAIEWAEWNNIAGHILSRPPKPYCWKAQKMGDRQQHNDTGNGQTSSTLLRATLTIQLPWGEMKDLLVFEDQTESYVRYRIHKPNDLLRAEALLMPGDGLALCRTMGFVPSE
ncbi:MAG: hypothetical protein JNM62_08725 [Flavobacteriales bacterium]|nr:hypothetical protein [Flavobacteriales bacterium]